MHTSPLQKTPGGIELVFGPEGGFPREEVDAAADAAFQVLSLGPRILKAETANIAAVAIVQHLLHNM